MDGTISAEEYQFRKDVLERTARIETLLVSLAGNGKPGRIDLIEADVKELQEAKATQRGIVIAISGVVSTVIALIGLAAEYLHLKL